MHFRAIVRARSIRRAAARCISADPPIVAGPLMAATPKRVAVFGQCFYHAVAIFLRGSSRLRSFRARFTVPNGKTWGNGRGQNATGRHVVAMHVYPGRIKLVVPVAGASQTAD